MVFVGEGKVLGSCEVGQFRGGFMRMKGGRDSLCDGGVVGSGGK